MSLTFDREAHRYYWNGQPVPNVTRVLGLIVDLSRVPADVLENARQEGVAIHRTVELYSKGDLDEETLPEWLRPRLDAYKRFLAETGFEIEASEELVYHPIYRYAGTADLFGRFRAKPRPAVVDVKRSFYGGRAIGLQTAAYGEARREAARTRANPSQSPYDRFALQLREDGTYRLQEYTNTRDFPNFLACLATYRLKEELAA